jgi:Zn-dependent M28 family amino/carboxypeptidase
MRLAVAALACAPPLLPADPHPRDREIHDADTRAWWHMTESLSNDAMKGRDTGTAAYQRAADDVAAAFKAAGLERAGEHGYFQSVPMHEIAVTTENTSFTLLRADGSQKSLDFLQQITVAPAANMPPQLEAPLTFRGYCGKESLADAGGKIVICFGTQRAGLPGGAARAANAREAGALALINVDDPYFTIEPPRWPYAYARTVTLQGPAAAGASTLISLRISADAFKTVLEGSGRDAASLLELGGTQQPLPSFDIAGRLRVRLHVLQRDIASPNVLAVLPGASAKLAQQYVVVSAHLDGYGLGTAVAGDNLYNGTLDDAAYVALLIQFARNIKAHALARPKRSILFAAFTAEEKGLLGSTWFVAHSTVPVEKLAADVNLDQLRPLFPLKILTAEALGESDLGDIARGVAAGLGIEIRPDAEPERNLLRRADQYPFLTIHVPAISFIFGYDPDSDAERRYREWYQVRYHRPQDDLTQPVDFAAAAQFNQFFYNLVEAIAARPARPAFYSGSAFAAQN